MSNNENELKIQIKYKTLSKRFLTLINKIRQDEDLQGEIKSNTQQITYYYNGHNTLNRHRFGVDITWICQKKISINFHVFSTYFFEVISMGENPHCFDVLFPTQYQCAKIRRYYNERKIDVIFMYIFRKNFDLPLVNIFLMNYFHAILMD